MAALHTAMIGLDRRHEPVKMLIRNRFFAVAVLLFLLLLLILFSATDSAYPFDRV